MNIETKLTFNDIKKNKKRTLFTIISITLCTVLIFTTTILISSIRNGITDNIEIGNNDYQIEIDNLDIATFNNIKNNANIDKIYVQYKDNVQLEQLEKPYELENSDSEINVYIKFNDIKKTCQDSTEIIQIVEAGKADMDSQGKANNIGYKFNQKLLTVYGLIDVETVEANNNLTCVARVNYSYVIDILIILILVIFSVIFIIILYNAFLITVNERKKEYAILNSVGGTEGQILKMLFLKGIIMGIVGVILGGIISIFCSNIILDLLNKILAETGYNFRLVLDAKYIVISVLIIIVNIFIASIIPSLKASTSSVIQGIRNNNEIKTKKRISLLERILPIEGRIAVKNIRRVKSKYKIITILLVICMTSYIVVSTYITYERKTADLVDEYDSDAELMVAQSVDYKSILKDYETKTGDNVEYLEYKELGLFILVEPADVFIDKDNATEYEDNKKGIRMVITGLDDSSYKKYLEKINANYGDIIIYNNMRLLELEEGTYKYETVFKQGYNLKLSIIEEIYNFNEEMESDEDTDYDDEETIAKYNIIDSKSLDGNIVLTDKLIDGYKDMREKYMAPFIIVNMDKFNDIRKIIDTYISQNNTSQNDESSQVQFIMGDQDYSYIKVKCGNIIEFSNYVNEIIRNDRSKNIDRISNATYYTLETQEKIIYINIIELILKFIIIAIVIIGIISILNILNASVYERKQEFIILNSLGATDGNIDKILIYESLYMFIKAMIISIILSMPMIYLIVKYMENIISFDHLLIPIGDICIFLGILLLISLGIAVYSIRIVKEK